MNEKQGEAEHAEADQQFKAREVPWASKVKMYDLIQQKEEEERRKRIAARSARMLGKSALPPRMEHHQKTKGAVEKMKKKLAAERARKRGDTGDEQATFRPKINPVVRPKSFRFPI